MANFFSSPYKDSDIILSIRTGGRLGEKGIKTLFQAHLGYISKGQGLFGLLQEEARSAYHDAVLGLEHMVNQDRFEQRAKLSTILYTLFKRKCIDQKNKQIPVEKEISLEYAFPNLNEQGRSFLDQIMEKEELSIVSQLMKEIGENCFELLILHAKGYNDQEIADQLTYSNPNVVKTRRYKCRRKLSIRFTNYSDSSL